MANEDKKTKNVIKQDEQSKSINTVIKINDENTTINWIVKNRFSNLRIRNWCDTFVGFYSDNS